MPQFGREFLREVVAWENLVGKIHRYQTDLVYSPHGFAGTASVVFPAADRSKNFRARNCERRSPYAEASCLRSSAESMSSPIPCKVSTTQGCPLPFAAARCGRKLSLPKRSGNK